MGRQITLYHYTSGEGADGILDSGFIRKSLQGPGGRRGDARHGSGVYMTSKDPAGYTRKQIAYNNYDGRTMSSKAVKNAIKAGKVDVALELVFDIDDPNLSKVDEKDGRDVWKYDGDLSLEDTLKAVHHT